MKQVNIFHMKESIPKKACDIYDCTYEPSTILVISYMIDYKTKEIEILRRGEWGDKLFYE